MLKMVAQFSRKLLPCAFFLCAIHNLQADDINLSIVRHHWVAKIVESNYVTIRPGSVYDMRTYFEENFGLLRPRFNYLFLDTGLGTADPIYPIFQKGYQESWAQLLRAALSDKNRHIDHYSELKTPEGCLNQSAYFVRHINEFPDRYQEEREAGYTLVDIGFDYYTKLKPDAECGRHRANNPDPKFSPLKFIRKYAKAFRTGGDIPAEVLKKFEFKIGLLKLVRQSFGRGGMPRFKDVYSPEKNSLWYYPNGIVKDYGLKTPHPQVGLSHLQFPRQLIFSSDDLHSDEYPLSRLVPRDDFDKYVNFLHGAPTPGFDAARDEPGEDAFSLAQITPKNFFSRGLEVIRMPKNVDSYVSEPESYKLVSMVIRPRESEADIHFAEPQSVPQLRFVYQLMDPSQPNLPVEQAYLHLMFDAIDRSAPLAEREKQSREFMKSLDALTALREGADPTYAKSLEDFISTYTARGMQSLSFSSSLTGIWVFGMLSRSFNPDRNLEAVRIVRNGVDVGYYSTAWDNEIFRNEAQRLWSDGHKAKALDLLGLVDEVTPRTYRDQRRVNVNAISFNKMTCAQCHQMSGRDAVHIAFNDHIDRRVTGPIRASEFTYRELDRQLKEGEQ